MSKGNKKFKLPSVADTALAVAGAILCGLGCGLVNFASVGMDSVGIFYDGIRNILNLEPDQIGYASYIVSFALSVFLLFADRKYVSFGSIKRFETTGQISLISLTKLANALDCTEDLRHLFADVQYDSIEEVIRERS